MIDETESTLLTEEEEKVKLALALAITQQKRKREDRQEIGESHLKEKVAKLEIEVSFYQKELALLQNRLNYLEQLPPFILEGEREGCIASPKRAVKERPSRVGLCRPRTKSFVDPFCSPVANLGEVAPSPPTSPRCASLNFNTNVNSEFDVLRAADCLKLATTEKGVDVNNEASGDLQAAFFKTASYVKGLLASSHRTFPRLLFSCLKFLTENVVNPLLNEHQTLLQTTLGEVVTCTIEQIVHSDNDQELLSSVILCMADVNPRVSEMIVKALVNFAVEYIEQPDFRATVTSTLMTHLENFYFVFTTLEQAIKKGISYWAHQVDRAHWLATLSSCLQTITDLLRRPLSTPPLFTHALCRLLDLMAAHLQLEPAAVPLVDQLYANLMEPISSFAVYKH